VIQACNPTLWQCIRLKCNCFLWLACMMIIVPAQTASSHPPYKHSLKKLYGARLNANLHQCATCHLTKSEVGIDEEFDEENPPHNVFGEALKVLGDEIGEDEPGGDIISRIKRLAEEDTDGDGVANELEILAGKHPGRKESRPDEQELLAAQSARDAREREATGYAWEPFRPVVRPAIPGTKLNAWVKTPIDAFVAAEYERLGLQPAAEASKHHLLRRLYLDLVGIPPTREQLLQFIEDDTSTAYEQVVERLLASPEYGQRWGRHWMDIWRYSDWAGWTDGGQIRDSQPHIWRWRDWIIESLNSDRPYDSMVQAMLAADELTPTDADDLRATGYLVRNYKLLSRETWMQETVEHTCKALLAITMNCARCHDHMYDPISQAEYYQFRAIFEPHNVRLDRVAHQPDVKIDGLARTYDAELNAETYLFVKGDDRHPDKERTIAVNTPSILGPKLVATPVELPVSAYYPGYLPLVRNQMVEAAQASLNKAREELARAESATVEAGKLVSNENADVEQRRNHELAQQRLEVTDFAASFAALQLQSLQARIAADDVKYAAASAPNLANTDAANIDVTNIDVTNTDAANTDAFKDAEKKAASLAQEAQSAELELVIRQAELAVAEIEGKLTANADDTELDKNLADAKQKQEQAVKAFEEAKEQFTEAPLTTYSPLTPMYPQQSTGRRTALAQWLTSRENPLTARVAVNHIWNRRFGRGLVPSIFDFGQNGAPPTHPALLDWLAAELMEPSHVLAGSRGSIQPWSMKHIHRLMVMSSVYRLSTQSDAQQIAQDPDNEYLGRAQVKRMEAEIVRDSVMYVAGSLDLGMGGPDIDFNQGFQVPRRSLYFRHAAEKEMTFLKVFDAAAVTECYQRKTSIMPQQALAMINSELTITQARRLVRNWKDGSIEEPALFAKAMFEHILSRAATEEEVTACVQFLADCTNRPATVEFAAALIDLGKPSADPAIRAREQLVHVLLNHHEFVSIY